MISLYLKSRAKRTQRCFSKVVVDVVGVVTNSLVIHFPDVFKVWNKILK